MAHRVRKTWLLALVAAALCHSALVPLFVPPARGHVNFESPTKTSSILPAVPAMAMLTPLAAWADSDGDWFEPFVSLNAQIIEGIDGVIGSAGFSIVLYTILIKVVTAPLQQPALRTSALMQLLSPQTDEIERKYPLDEEGRGRTLRELYGKVGLNPFAAFLPILVQLPIFVALFRAIGKLASQDDHFKESFLWIPSLAGPVESGRPSLDWLLKTRYSDHFEPLVGWQDAGFYLILPLLVFLLQFFSNRMSAASKETVSATALAPLFIAISTLVSPQGVGIYWFTNTLLTTVQLKFTQNQVAEEFPEYKKIKDAVDAEQDGMRYTRSSPFKKNELVAKSVEDLEDPPQKKAAKPKSRNARRKKTKARNRQRAGQGEAV
ncbi:Inner membrane ALBINO3-like protein 2 [Durusdinium trenchii]|uniref:Chloroplastic n=1 Tax=Durusdinium trenchii TaxID=1381693 RepID=A0ABP0Q7P7_9DINO